MSNTGVASTQNSCNAAGETLDCGGKARNERRHRLGDACAENDAVCARPKTPQKAAWRFRFPPHSKASPVFPRVTDYEMCF